MQYDLLKLNHRCIFFLIPFLLFSSCLEIELRREEGSFSQKESPGDVEPGDQVPGDGSDETPPADSGPIANGPYLIDSNWRILPLNSIPGSSVSALTGTAELEFEVIPQNDLMDGVIGLSHQDATSYAQIYAGLI